MVRKLLIIVAVAIATFAGTGCGLFAGAAVAVPFELAKGTVGLTFYTVGGTIELADKANEAAYKKAKRDAELQVIRAKALAAVSAMDEME